MSGAPEPGGLQESVRRTRARLARAEIVADLDGIRSPRCASTPSAPPSRRASRRSRTRQAR